MSEWLPIEAAPKDGTEVLIAANIYQSPYHKPMYKIVPKIAKFSTYDGYWRCSEPESRNLNLSPKYWMPLPKIPVDA